LLLDRLHHARATELVHLLENPLLPISNKRPGDFTLYRRGFGSTAASSAASDELNRAAGFPK
jgi:hypothetical protein